MCTRWILTGSFPSTYSLKFGEFLWLMEQNPACQGSTGAQGRWLREIVGGSVRGINATHQNAVPGTVRKIPIVFGSANTNENEPNFHRLHCVFLVHQPGGIP
jgi:hypothetical protein